MTIAIKTLSALSVWCLFTCLNAMEQKGHAKLQTSKDGTVQPQSTQASGEAEKPAAQQEQQESLQSSLQGSEGAKLLCDFDYDIVAKRKAAADILDKQSVSPVLGKSELPLIFFQNDYKLTDDAQKILEKVALHLACGSNVEDAGDQAALEAQRYFLAEWCKRTRPQIALLPKEKAMLTHEVKKHILETKTYVHAIPDTIAKIKRIEAVINDAQNAFNLKTWVTQGLQNVAREENVLIDLSSPGICIAINRYNCYVYIGCKDGSIYVFDANNNKQVQELKGHAGPITALNVICDGKALVSKTADATFVWSVNDDRPRLALEERTHSKTYLVNKALIRSHLDGKSLLGSFMGKDGIYKIPEGYLYGAIPGDDLRRIAFFYLLHKIANAPEANYDVSAHLKGLYNSFVCKTFEPPVTRTIKEYLKKIAEKHDLALSDTSFELLKESE